MWDQKHCVHFIEQGVSYIQAACYNNIINLLPNALKVATIISLFYFNLFHYVILDYILVQNLLSLLFALIRK